MINQDDAESIFVSAAEDALAIARSSAERPMMIRERIISEQRLKALEIVDAKYTDIMMAVGNARRPDNETRHETALRRVQRADQAWECKANKTADPPQDCDWPVCGCDPYAAKVIDALGCNKCTQEANESSRKYSGDSAWPLK